MALIFLRHAEPLVEAGVCYGQSDVGARHLSKQDLDAVVRGLPATLTAIDTSPLSRCTQLAELIADRFKLPLRIDPRLREIDFGRWEMTPWDDIPRDEIDAWAADVTGANPHGGETVREMTERVKSYLENTSFENSDILAVTHMGVVRCAHASAGYDGALEMKLGYAQTMKFNQRPDE
ncbi:MAG: alpha-ribazole phosphatase family protein [Pseudomonadota bacterium]